MIYRNKIRKRNRLQNSCGNKGLKYKSKLVYDRVGLLTEYVYKVKPYSKYKIKQPHRYRINLNIVFKSGTSAHFEKLLKQYRTIRRYI